MFRALLLIGCVAQACYATAEVVKGEAELGFVRTSGNTETQNINAKLKLTKDTQSWKHEANFAALNNSSRDQDTGVESTTAEKYNIDLKSDRKLDERSYVYVLTTYEDDRFSGFDYQATLGLGYGYKVIAEENKNLALEIGPGYRYNSIEGAKDEDEMTLRLAEKFDWKFSDTAEFKQYIAVEGGDENTIATAGVSVQSSLTETLALKVGMDAKYTDEVPLNSNGSSKKHTDTETYASVTYSF